MAAASKAPPTRAAEREDDNNETLRVLVVSSIRLFQEAFATLMERQDGITIVGAGLVAACEDLVGTGKVRGRREGIDVPETECGKRDDIRCQSFERRARNWVIDPITSLIQAIFVTEGKDGARGIDGECNRRD